MQIDLRGRVDNTPLAHHRALTPIFEAISNSIHSIGDLGKTRGGVVHVHLEREGEEDDGLFGEGAMPISSIVITDDGIGFDQENFRAFGESDTTHKRQRGGKGMGRLFWLKVFEYAEIDSSFRDNGDWKRRTFRFTYSRDGIEQHRVFDAATYAGTSVRLVNVKRAYAASLPKTAETFAFRIAEHFLQLLFDFKCPRIIVEDGGEQVDVNQLFSERFAAQSGVEDFSIDDVGFTIRHILNTGSAEHPGHFVHFFAHDRGVVREPVTKFLPGAPKTTRLLMGDQAFFYLGIVAGALLDSAVDFSRNSFDLPDVDTALGGGISMAAINRAVTEKVGNYLAPFLAPVQEAKFDRVRHLARREPQYRFLLKHHQADIEGIAPDITDEGALDTALRRIEFEVRAQHRIQAEQLRRRKVTSVEDIEEYKKEFDIFIERENELGQLSLAQYVAHRHVVIELLEKFFGLDDRGGYQFEELIHKIICPMRITSDEAEFENHNLWLVDERMEFHEYLASDTTLRANEITESVELVRPDLLVFNRRMAFGDERPFSSIVIVEFKRPQRDDYNAGDNPVDQIEDYIYRLRQKRLKDERGRFIDPPENLQFFGYVICDITPTMRALAEKRGWPSAPDGQGFFLYNGVQKSYIEVISYDKMLNDAKKRNRVLFEKLNLSTL